MSTVARSFLLGIFYLMVVASQYFIAHSFGHEIVFAAYPSIVPEPELYEHLALQLLVAMVSLGLLFGLLMGNPTAERSRPRFDADWFGRYRVCMGLAGVLYLIIFFAFVGLPDNTTYGVLMLDLVLLIGVVARIGWWVTEGRTTSMSNTS